MMKIQSKSINIPSFNIGYCVPQSNSVGVYKMDAHPYR